MAEFASGLSESARGRMAGNDAARRLRCVTYVAGTDVGHRPSNPVRFVGAYLCRARHLALRDAHPFCATQFARAQWR